MGYTLSASDRDKLQKVIKDVNALTISKKQGRSFNQYNREYTYVKLTENVLDGGNPTLFWYASEVGFDTAGLPVVKTNGKVWSASTNPLLIEGAEGAVDDILRVEPSALSDGSLIWLALKPEGGGGALWAKITSGSGQAYLGDIYDDPIETNPALETGATVNAYNVDFGDVPIGRIYRCDLVGSVYYIEPSTFGG